jgi:Right handed beta helix region
VINSYPWALTLSNIRTTRVQLRVAKESRELQRELADKTRTQQRELAAENRQHQFALASFSQAFQRRMAMESRQWNLLMAQKQQEHALSQLEQRKLMDTWPLENLYPETFVHAVPLQPPVPLTVLIAPPALEFDSAKAQQQTAPQLALREQRIYSGLRRFLEQHYSERGSSRPVLLMDGAWKTKRSFGGATVRELHYVLRSHPFLILETAISGKVIEIRAAYWGIGQEAPWYKTVGQFPYDALVQQSAKDHALEWIADRDALAAKSYDLEALKKLADKGYAGAKSVGLREYNAAVLMQNDERERLGSSQLIRYEPAADDYNAAVDALVKALCFVGGWFADLHHLVHAPDPLEVLPVLPELLPALLDDPLPDDFAADLMSEFVSSYTEAFDALMRERPYAVPAIAVEMARGLSGERTNRWARDLLAYSLRARLALGEMERREAVRLPAARLRSVLDEHPEQLVELVAAEAATMPELAAKAPEPLPELVAGFEAVADPRDADYAPQVADDLDAIGEHALAAPVRGLPTAPPRHLPPLKGEDGHQGPRLIVDPEGGWHRFTTIQEAIEAARPGESITVEPGTYHEAIVLDRHVEIIGDGPRDQIIIESAVAPCLRVETEVGTVRSVTFRCPAPSDGNAAAVDIAQGSGTLDDCDISAQSATAIRISGPGTSPTIQRCVIHDGADVGVDITGGATPAITDCEISGTARTGVAIREKANPALTRCTIRDGEQYGVDVYKEGLGRLEDCQISGNAFTGVEIREKANPALTRCTIRDGKQSGVYVHDDGQIAIAQCTISGNSGFAVWVKNTAAATVTGSRLTNNRRGAWNIESGAQCNRTGNTPDVGQITRAIRSHRLSGKEKLYIGTAALPQGKLPHVRLVGNLPKNEEIAAVIDVTLDKSLDGCIVFGLETLYYKQPWEKPKSIQYAAAVRKLDKILDFGPLKIVAFKDDTFIDTCGSGVRPKLLMDIIQSIAKLLES